MISNPDATLAAIYYDPRGGYYSRPIAAIDLEDGALAYVTDEYGDLIPADEFGDLAFIETNAVINGQEPAA